MSFMFQGMCTEVRVLHKKKAKRGGEKRKKRLRVSESTQLFSSFRHKFKPIQAIY